MTDIALRSSEMKNRLNSHCISIIDSQRLIALLVNIVVCLVHVDTVSYELVGSSPAENVLDVVDVGERRKQ